MKTENMNETGITILNNIETIEKSIKNGIDDAVDSLDGKVTISEVYAALINTLKTFNKQEITNLIASEK